MALARYQFTVVDDAGNVIPNASVEVRREVIGSPIVPLFADRAGAVAIGNPLAAGADGFVAFHVASGAYRITATAGSVSRSWRYVGIGLAAETDVLTTGASWVFDAATADADPGAGLMRFNHAAPGSVSQIFFDTLTRHEADLSAWLDGLDGYGSIADRGLLTVQSADLSAIIVARVTGTVVAGTGYRKVSVTPLSTAGTFVAGGAVSVSFSPSPLNGEVGGPGAVTSSGQLAVWADGSGTAIAGAAAGGPPVPLTANDVLAGRNAGKGKQSIWIPGSALYQSSGLKPDLGFPQLMQATVIAPQFDAAAFEGCYAFIGMPKSWNGGALTAKFFWRHVATSASYGVLWFIACKFVRNDDTLIGSQYSNGVVVHDTGGTVNDLYISPETSPFIPEGTVTDEGMLSFEIARAAQDGSDNFGSEATLLGVQIFYTTNDSTDN